MSVDARSQRICWLAAILVAAGLWFGGSAQAQAPRIRIIQGNPLIFGNVDDTVRTATNLLSQAIASARANATGDMLQLLDGSVLHGRLRTMDPNGVLTWQHPFAPKPMEFSPAALYQIRFEQRRTGTNDLKYGCRFRFRNGDEVLGDIVTLDTNRVELVTQFGGHLTAPREALQSIVFFQKGFMTKYDGPNGQDGWKIGPAGDAWRYSDGMFVAGGVGFLGRDMELPALARVSFDLRWAGQLNLMASFYTDALDRFDFGSNGYLLSINSGYINVQRMQGGRGLVHLGQAQVPELMTRNRAQFELRFNRNAGLVLLLVDGVVAQEFRDATPAGLAEGKDSGITFYSQRSGANMRISEIKVAEWDGRMEETAVTNQEGNVVRLVNNDRVNGDVLDLHDGKLRVQLSGTPLDIPSQRITQIMFGGAPQARPATGNLVTAELSSGGRVSLVLQTWTEKELSGQSPNFGAISLKPEWLRMVRFNPGRKLKGADLLDVEIDDPLNLDQ